MSQVKKFQTGGSLTIDGKKYDVTPELIQNLSGYLSSYGDTAAPLAGLTSALQRGANVVYDSVGNTITGMDGQWAGVDEKGESKYDANRSQWRKNWDATFNNDAHKWRKSLRLLSGFSGYGLSGNNPQTDVLDNILGNETWFDYITNEDGTKTYSKDSAKNALIKQRLDKWSKGLPMTEEDFKKTYSLDSWYTPDKVAGIRAIYGNYATPEQWQARIAEIEERAQNNTLTPEDKQLLAAFNIVEGANPNAAADAEANKNKNKWIGAGLGDLYDRLGGIATLNDDGSIQLNPGESWGWDLGDLNGHNIYFNEDFYNSKYGADGSFDPFKGLTLYKNKLYQLSSPTLAKILNSEGGFNAMMTSGNWTGADNEILTRFTDAARENPVLLDKNKYSEFLSDNPNYRFSDLTGLYSVDNMDDSDQIIQYIDLKDSFLDGPYRNYNYKFALLDKNGKLKRTLNSTDLHEIVNGSARETGLETLPFVTGTGNKVYDNKYYQDILDSEGKASGFRIYRDPTNKSDNVVLHMPNIKAGGLGDNTDLVLPKEFAEVLFSNPNLINNIVGDAQKQKDFISVLSRILQSKYRQSSGSNALFAGMLPGIIGAPMLFTKSDKRALKNLGFKDEELQILLESLNKMKSGNRSDRISRYSASTPISLQNVQSEKNGGTIKPLPKYLAGGKSGGSKKAIAVSETRADTSVANYQNAAGIGEVGSKNWTDDDTKDLIALGMDLGSLGAAFTPATFVAAGVGAGASSLRFAANRGRDTKNAGGQYALDLALDAASLIPGLKTIKTIKAVKNSLPTLLKLASVAGLGSAFVNTVNKVASGEKFTSKDISIIANGITAGVNLKRTGGFGKQTSKTTKGYSETIKVGDKEISLDDKTIKSVLKADDQPKALREAIKSDPNSNGLKDSEIASAAESVLKERRSLWQRLRRKDGDIVLDVKKKKLKGNEFTQEQIDKMRGFEKWWRGLGTEQTNYAKWMAGETPTETKAFELSRQDTNVFPTKPRKFRTKGTVQSKEIPMSEYKGRNFTSEVIPGGFNELNGPGMVALPGIANYRGYFTRQLPIQLRALSPVHIINPFTDSNYQLNQWQQPQGLIMRPLYKKGGKIRKAEDGTEFNQNYLDSLLKGSISAAEQFRDKNSASWMTSGEDISKLAASKRWLDPITKPDTKLDEVLDPKVRLTTSYDPHSTIKNQIIKRNEENAEQAPAISHQGTIEGKPYNVDLNPIMNWARSLYSMHQSDRQLKNWLGRDRFQMQEFLLNAPRYINSGTGDAYRNLANSQRLHKNVTSDPTANWGEQQQQLQTALQSELQGHLADSQEFGKYIGGLAEFLNNNALKRTDIANQNRQYRVADNQADVLQKNTNIAEKSKFFDQAAYSTQDWYNRKQQAKKNTDALQYQQGSYQILDNLYRNKMNEWNNKYPTQEAQNTPKAQMELTWIKNYVMSQKNNIDSTTGTMMMAKGGKASKVTYSRDPYPELLIQNAKDSTKLVEKLNDSTIKLLLSIKPIHVS